VRRWPAKNGSRVLSFSPVPSMIESSQPFPQSSPADWCGASRGVVVRSMRGSAGVQFCVISFAYRFCNRLPLEIFNSSAVLAASAPLAPPVLFCTAGDASAPEPAMRSGTGRTPIRAGHSAARDLMTRILLILDQPARARPLKQLRRSNPSSSAAESERFGSRRCV